MTPTEMESRVRNYFDAVSAGDAAKLLAIFAPDLRWRVPKGAIEPYAGEHIGAQKVVDMMLGAVDHLVEFSGNQLLGKAEAFTEPYEVAVTEVVVPPIEIHGHVLSERIGER